MRIFRRRGWEFIEPEPESEPNIWNMLTLMTMGAIIAELVTHPEGVAAMLTGASGTAEDLILGAERVQDWNYYASRFVD